ncbi:uncharacterized protein LOC129733104 [Wyeomyia smithii]|uniref:uncharacterized protein LOC129733104 n=1 Tax=Wyeomyia smithii TaxID=174621 RepID=UPI002467D4B8|nr:uncharacterized protein LOC129733104 [Wyeomyia smithii]
MPMSNIALSRISLLRDADGAYSQGSEEDAIFLSTEAMCAGIHQKFDTQSRKLPHNENTLASLVNDLGAEIKHDVSESDLKAGFTKLHKCCRELPKQWTVIQIHKVYTPRWNLLTHKELLEEKTAVELILFTYPNSEVLNDKPILIRLEPPDESDFFPLLSSIPVKLKRHLKKEIESGTMRQEEMESYIGTIIDRLIAWLGPWVAVFSGKFISSMDEQMEGDIFNRVEDFCITNKRSKKEQVLISLIARRLDLLDVKAIYRFCCDVIRQRRETQKKLFSFLVKLKHNKFDTNQMFGCSPCLMVVDELLDGYPWEMVNTMQEFSRLGSFRLLWQLYRTHKANIAKGYLQVAVKNCHNIINPDKTLIKMSTRLQAFYKEWYPNFKLIVDEPPTDAQFTSILHEADVMIYNGHGSGLQFLDGDTIIQHDIRSLIFLFGCDSVRLFPNGLFNEMSGSHLYYNIAKCATVVGALWVLTDFYTDYYSILLVSGWIPTTNVALRDYSVLDLDPTAFKNGKFVLGNKQSVKPPEHCDDSLLQLMALFRRRKWLPKRIRCAMVCRGLPVINSNYFES